jgi:hypothetical protein
MVRLLGLFSATHIPLPYFAFLLPLFRQEPLVYMVILSWSRFSPLVGFCSLWAGVSDILSCSVKILKPSAMLDLIVVVGSNRISPTRCSKAWLFFSFLQ